MFFQLLQRNATGYATDPAICFGDNSLTHIALLALVERRAQNFLCLGLGVGDRVALILDNGPGFIATFFAVAACRAINVPISPELKKDEYWFFLNDAHVRAVVVTSRHAKTITDIAATLPWHIDVLIEDPKSEEFDSRVGQASSNISGKLREGSPDDDIVYLYTSGTTDRPKCVPRTVTQYWSEMHDVIETLNLSRADVIFCAIPLFHNFGLVQCMLVAVGVGARLIILKSRGPFRLYRDQALRLISDKCVTVFPSVPFILESLVESSEPFDLTSIRLCYSAAAKLRRETSKAFLDKFGVQIRDHYGCTEVGAMTIDLEPGRKTKANAVGKAFKGVRIKVIGNDGQVLRCGETGEIAVRSRAMTRGYISAGLVDRSAFAGGFFHTGDIGHLDKDGTLYLSGRKKNFIDIVGHKVNLVEIENTLREHPEVVDAIVIAVPNVDGNGKSVAAYVVGTPCCALDALEKYCRERLANYKVPQSIEFISNVPKNTLGKALRDRGEIERLLIDSIEKGLADENDSRSF